ncbi:MAG: phage tail protein [Pseudomonadota bacterium]|nr:phage tail protein [Pseudomonadota bacterium]QKK04381.1 MAG: phage tail protein [Pseudomonadota bacterium]
MPIPYWAGHYIGLPFREHGRSIAGTDCWGLVRLVLQEQFAAVLPSYAADYQTTGNATELGKLIGQEAEKWIAISAGQEKLGDVIVLRMRGAPMHVGLVLGDGRMLHIEKHINSAIEDYRSRRWRERVTGFYRHPQLEK